MNILNTLLIKYFPYIVMAFLTIFGVPENIFAIRFRRDERLLTAGKRFNLLCNLFSMPLFAVLLSASSILMFIKINGSNAPEWVFSAVVILVIIYIFTFIMLIKLYFSIGLISHDGDIKKERIGRICTFFGILIPPTIDFFITYAP